MLSKPEEKKEQGETLAPPAPLKTQAAADSVKDLERRLQMMSEAETKPKPAAAPKPAPKPAVAAPPAAAGGGKNALLVSSRRCFCESAARLDCHRVEKSELLRMTLQILDKKSHRIFLSF